MAEQAYAYVTLIPVAKGFQRRVADELSGAAPAAATAGARTGRAFSGAVKAGIAVGAAAATTAVAGLGVALTKGFGRLQAIEEAQSLLIGTGNSAADVERVMENALAAVKGTAFGLGDAARVAAGAVAAGIEPGEDLERTLKAVADTAAVAGAPIGEIGAIFNKVTTANRAYTLELNQLADRGIPIYQYLADQVGVTAEEIRGMASDGEISSEMFRQALADNISGAALEMGETVSGSFANVQAAIGRVGANLLGPIYGRFAEFFNATIEGLGPLEDKAKDLGESIGNFLNPRIDTLVEFARNLSVPISTVSIFFDRLRDSAGGVATFFAPVVQSATTMLSALPALIPFVQQLAEFFAELALQVFPVLIEVMSGLMSTVMPQLISAVADLGPKVLEVVKVLADMFLPVLLTLAQMAVPILSGVLSVIIPVIQFFATVISATDAGLARVVAVTALLVKGVLIAKAAFTAVRVATSLWYVASLRLLVTLRAKLGAMFGLITRMGVYTATILRNVVVATSQAVAWAAQKTALVATTIATKAATFATKAWNLVLSMSPLGKIISLITLIATGLVLFITQTDAGRRMWKEFTDFFLAAVSAIGEFFTFWFSEVLPAVWASFTEFLGNGWQAFKDFFLFALEGIGNFFKSYVNGWISLFEGFVNGLISGVNWVIRALNRISFSIPNLAIFGDLAGKTFGVNISQIGRLNLPRLAEGGLVTGPTTALIGEAGPEVVIPLDRFESMMGGDGMGGTVNYYAAPNKSFDAEQELLLAMRRARLAA